MVVGCVNCTHVVLFPHNALHVLCDSGDYVLVPPHYTEKLRRVAWARTLLGLSSILIPASFGSTFHVSLGLSSPWSWGLGAIGYGAGIVQALLRKYYLGRYVYP